MRRSSQGPLVRVSHLVFALINSEASYIFVKIKQKLCANVPKGVPQQI